jgi:hypothetical protein
MHVSQAIYRRLLETMSQGEHGSLYWQTLAPWVEEHQDEVKWLRAFAERPGEPIPPATKEDLWRLYALSLLNETLLLRFQCGRADGTDWPGPKISADEYLIFMASLGMRAVESYDFSPFHHEVVTVNQTSDAGEPPELAGTYWPCLMLGPMMFSRAGVAVRVGTEFMVKDVAENSTLYWAYRRKNRDTNDLGKGWGSNSRWRTDFRRDYMLGSEAFFNVDQKNDLALSERDADRDGLTRAERIELLENRCLLKSSRPSGDLWPYYDTMRRTIF